MAADKRKKRFSTYILPILFCGLLIALAVMMHLNPTAPGVAVIYPITWTTTSLCQLGYMLVSRCMYLKQPERLPD